MRSGRKIRINTAEMTLPLPAILNCLIPITLSQRGGIWSCLNFAIHGHDPFSQSRIGAAMLFAIMERGFCFYGQIRFQIRTTVHQKGDPFRIEENR